MSTQGDRGACVAITCRMKDYKLGVLVGTRAPNVKWWPGFMQFPGGKLEDGESSIDAIFRECLEETGYHLYNEHIGYLGPIDCTYANGFKYKLHMHTYHNVGSPDNLLSSIENKEPDKNLNWQLLSVHTLIRNHPANMLPGMWELLCRL